MPTSENKPNLNTEWIQIGKFGAPHGIDGEIRVFSLSDVPDRLQKLKEAWWLGESNEIQHLIVKSCRSGEHYFLMRFQNICQRETAARLTNGILAVPIHERGKLPKEQFFIDDILGLDVVNESGNKLGKIHEVYQTGANDVYAVGIGKNEYLIPAIKQVILKVDMQQRIMLVHFNEKSEI